MNKLEPDPRVTQGPGFFNALIEWMRRAALAVNALVDATADLAKSIDDKIDALAPGGVVPIAHGGTGETNANDARAALGAVAKAGDTMNGSLVVSSLVPTVSVDKTSFPQVAQFAGKSGGVMQWGVVVGDSAGDFAIDSYNGSGVWQRSILRATTGGNTTLFAPRINIATPDLRITGIATTASAANLFQDPGNGYIYRSTSSLRYKRDVRTLTAEEASVIYRLRPVRYRSVAEADPKDWTFYGFIAEEAADQDPRFVVFRREEDGSLTPDGMQYDRLTVPVVFEMQRLRADLDRALERIAILEGGQHG